LDMPIQLSPPTLMSDGSTQITLQAPPWKTYVIEASADLLTWTPILTNTLSDSTWNFVDFGGTNLPGRFYRAVSSP
jgi:hypothetical protein